MLYNLTGVPLRIVRTSGEAVTLQSCDGVPQPRPCGRQIRGAAYEMPICGPVRYDGVDRAPSDLELTWGVIVTSRLADAIATDPRWRGVLVVVPLRQNGEPIPDTDLATTPIGGFEDRTTH